MPVSRQELESYLKKLLLPQDLNDYGPNGLQVEGKEQITKIAFAVSASRQVIEEAIKQGADALIVHHGLFWSFHPAKTITGPFAKRVIPLIKNDVNLFGFHLPLDGHPEIGNAALLAKALDVTIDGPFGEYKRTITGAYGHLNTPLKAKEFKNKLETLLKRSPTYAGPDEEQVIHTVGIITGGASSNWYDAYQMGLDAYITGEISEHAWHDSQEHGVHMFAAGHNATEEFGIKGLMDKIQIDFALNCFFIPSVNPV